MLEKHVDWRLADCGITAETELFSIVLTSESSELYHSAVEEANKQSPYTDFIDQYRNIINGNEGQPRVSGNIISNMIGFNNPFMPSSDDRGIKIADNVDLSNLPRDLERMYSGATDKYCRQCGTKRPEYAKYCPECGKKYN